MLTTIAKDHHNEATELRGLFEIQLKQLYWAEDAIVKLLTGIISQVYSNDLVKLLNNHVNQTIGHTGRLDNIFTAIGLPAEAAPYDALKCLIKEAEALIQGTNRGVVRDAGIIAVLQKIKHYEIACYGTMRAYALALREEDVVVFLEQTLEEEKGIDLLLTNVAEQHINIEAADKEI